eukprot:CAMPEP_0182821818 /NCGR_PEP_ID=MMETSP0006_2-20121128/13875_1 /TAXON_ID=97485 /ORGANISM="Prymnesium parvum, Strain Texoma1" /LENGTH=122 /DNA_ID=CAMNT_0024948605 /DNA_START=153 /DNA_END=519 /DNA_ORIENTATION=+
MTQELQHNNNNVTLMHMPSFTLSIDDLHLQLNPEQTPADGAARAVAVLPLDDFRTGEPKAMLTWETIMLEPRIGWVPETVGAIERRTSSTSSCGSWGSEGEGRGGEGTLGRQPLAHLRLTPT